MQCFWQQLLTQVNPILLYAGRDLPNERLPVASRVSELSRGIVRMLLVNRSLLPFCHI